MKGLPIEFSKFYIESLYVSMSLLRKLACYCKNRFKNCPLFYGNLGADWENKSMPKTNFFRETDPQHSFPETFCKVDFSFNDNYFSVINPFMLKKIPFSSYYL